MVLNDTGSVLMGEPAMITREEAERKEREKAARMESGDTWKGQKTDITPGDRLNIQGDIPNGVTRVPPKNHPFFKAHDSDGNCIITGGRKERREYAKGMGLEFE